MLLPLRIRSFFSSLLYHVRWLLKPSWQDAVARVCFQHKLEAHKVDGDSATHSRELLDLMHAHHALATTRNRGLVAQMRLIASAMEPSERQVHQWGGIVRTAEEIADQVIREETVCILLAKALTQTGEWEHFSPRIQKMGVEERLSVARLMLELEPERLLWLSFAMRYCTGQGEKIKELMLVQQRYFIGRYQKIARKMGWWQRQTDLEQLTATSIDRLRRLRAHFLQIADFQPEAWSVYDEAARQGAKNLARVWVAAVQQTEVDEAPAVVANR